MKTPMAVRFLISPTQRQCPPTHTRRWPCQPQSPEIQTAPAYGRCIHRPRVQTQRPRHSQVPGTQSQTAAGPGAMVAASTCGGGGGGGAFTVTSGGGGGGAGVATTAGGGGGGGCATTTGRGRSTMQPASSGRPAAITRLFIKIDRFIIVSLDEGSTEFVTIVYLSPTWR